MIDMLKNQIQAAVTQAMRDRDQLKLDSLRYLLSQIKNVEIDAHKELDDQEVIAVIQKEVKRRKDAIAQYEAAGRQDIVEKELAQLKLIEVYAPQLMNEDEITAVVDAIIASGKGEFAVVMGQVMGKLKGKADGATVNRIVREKLQSIA
jgi:uncharacterized protein YqeY